MKSSFIYIIIISLGLLLSSNVYAQGKGKRGARQTKGSISGKVIDKESKQALEFATISVLKFKDNSLVTGATTNSKGKFELDVPKGKYLLKVEFIAYESNILQDIIISDNSLHLNIGTIPLAAKTEVLEQVEVRAKKSQVQIALDKKVFNVGESLTQSGSNATEVLDNIPSVAVDLDGNVTLRGSENVRILVDGKPSGLVGIGEGTSALQSLPADIIDKVEVITNPSARYDAEGMSGIINIVLKKDRKKGFNGLVRVNTGYPHNHGLGVNLNFRRNKINFFTNIGGQYRNFQGGGLSSQTFTYPDTSYFTERDRTFIRTGLRGNVRLGADYFINKTTTLTGSVLYRQSIDNNTGDILYKDYNSEDVWTQTEARVEQEDEDEISFQGALNFKKQFSKKGQTFSIDAQYQENTEVEDGAIQEYLTDQNANPVSIPLEQFTDNKEHENTILFQTDYTHPFGKDGRLELGAKTTLRTIDNDYKVAELVDDILYTLPNFTNHFVYNENIYAAYALFGNKYQNWNYQFGLRSETTQIKTELKETEDTNTKQYTQLFPTAHLAYELADGNILQASYSRRIRRPRFRHLNPFRSYTDDRNIRQGNPDLDPMLTDAYELSYLKYWEAFTLSSSIYYRHTTDVIERNTNVENGITYSLPINLAIRDAYGFEFVLQGSITDLWTVTASTNIGRSITVGDYNNPITELSEHRVADTYVGMGRLTSRWRFIGGYGLQTSMNYRAPALTTQGQRKAMYFMDLGASKELFKRKATLTLSIRDLFNTRQYRYENISTNALSNETVETVGDFRRNTTQITLSFAYRINQKKRGSRGNRGNRNGGMNDGGDIEF